jgi:hypothetical protein
METVIQRLFVVAVSAVAWCAVPAAQADPVAELASFSVFQKVDLAQLAKGDAKPMRGPQTSTGRFLSVQTAWVQPGTAQQVMQALRQWNPARHPELRVLMHTNGGNFSRVSEAPNTPAVQWLANATVTKSPELQISKAEAAKLPASGSGMSGPVAWCAVPAAQADPVAEFWAGVLSSRAGAGVFAQPPYDHTGRAIRAGDEINAMLRENGKIQKQFSGLIGGGGDRFWEMIEVDKKAVLTLGASFNRGAAGGSQQAADVLYYASGGFYAAVTLYQMWPVEVEGRPSTLVWRGDFTSSAQVGDLRGVERLGSESAMIRDISRAVRLFRRDSAGIR